MINVRRTNASVGVALLLLGSVVAMGAAAGVGNAREPMSRGRYRRTTTKVAPGMTLTRMVDKRMPNRIRVLTMDPSTNLRIDMALAYGTLPGLEPTTDIARRRRALAAINGSVFLPWGRPVGIFAADGNLEATPLIYGNAFSVAQDELSSYFGHPEHHIDVRVLDTGAEWKVNSWNEGVPQENEVGGFSVHGGEYVVPPRRACAVRLYPGGGKSWGAGDDGVARDYTVDKVRCSYQRMPRQGGLVLATARDSKRADEIQALLPDQVVRLTWSVGWRQALDITAGNPLLMENGRNVGYRCSAAFCNRHPRTGIGLTADNKILLIVVDGRQKKYSVGMTPLEFANLFERLGATWAINLDGGGSTTMVVKGNIVNRPSDGFQRPVASAIVVVGRPDRGEKGPAPYTPPPEPSPTPTPLPTIPADPSSGTVTSPVLQEDRMVNIPAAGRRVLTDPASTGGLLDLIARGELPGAPAKLPPMLMRFARIFGAAH